jgi:hypothetical protein
MKTKTLLIAALLSFSQVVMAFNSNDEQINYVFKVVATDSISQKLEVLERLQWSTISDQRLYDSFEQALLTQYKKNDLDSDLEKVLLYQVRALGYSGNPKYKDTLIMLSQQQDNRKIRKTAIKALENLPTFINVQQLIAQVPLEQKSLPSEVLNYLRLLKTNDSYAQRLAAKAIFNEHHRQAELINLVADNLRKDYMNQDIDSLKQDTLAWYCKVLKDVGGYDELLANVAENSPHKKIQKYAAKK